MRWVGRDEALAIARNEVHQRGRTWVEPSRVAGGPLRLTVRSNAGARGGTIRIRIGRWSGDVVDFWVARR